VMRRRSSTAPTTCASRTWPSQPARPRRCGGHRVRHGPGAAPRPPILGDYPARFGHETAGVPGHRPRLRRRLGRVRACARAAPAGRRSAGRRRGCWAASRSIAAPLRPHAIPDGLASPGRRG
jgi:hypothetical protein